MDLTNFETTIEQEIFETVSRTFEELNNIASSENPAFPMTEKKALELAQKAFEQYLEAELIYQEILVQPITGEALQNIQKYVQKTLCGQRVDRLKQSIE